MLNKFSRLSRRCSWWSSVVLMDGLYLSAMGVKSAACADPSTESCNELRSPGAVHTAFEI